MIDSALPSPKRPIWCRASLAIFTAAGMTALMCSLAGFAARLHWRCEQLSHFRVQYFWLLTICAAVMLVGRKTALAVTFGGLAIIHLASIVPLYLRDAGAVPLASAMEGVSLRLMIFNVHSANSHREDVLNFVRTQHPDVAVFLEVSPQWSQSLASLTTNYPHQHHVPRNDNFGVAILSKWPWRSVETVQLEPGGVPSVVARFERDGATWVMIGAHPVPPASQWLSNARNKQLSALASRAIHEEHPVILAGDLNVTSWSPYFHDLLRDAELRDSRLGYGVQASWTSRLPLTDLPLDHVLVSPEIVVQSRSVGPHLGSDHRPVVAELLLPTQSRHEH